MLLLLLLVLPVSGSAQETDDGVSRQLWANFIVAYPKSDKLYLEVDAEAARQMSGPGDSWGYLYGTGLLEYYPSRWIDLTGELVTGYTRQDNTENSLEATVRLGVRLHLLRQIINSDYFEKVRPERISTKRFEVANLARIEQRNFWYSGDLPSTRDWRFRNRLEFKLALNRDSLGADGVWYLISDAEWFVPLNDVEAPERFATKRRIRLGLGYRHSYEWRFDVLAMRDVSRDTLEGEVSVEANMLDLRLHWYPGSD